MDQRLKPPRVDGRVSLSGPGRSVIVMLVDAHSAGVGILAFVGCMRAARALRVVDRDFKVAVTSFPWSHIDETRGVYGSAAEGHFASNPWSRTGTQVHGSAAVRHWASSFPNSLVATFSLVSDADLSVIVQNLTYLDLRFIHQYFLYIHQVFFIHSYDDSECALVTDASVIAVASRCPRLALLKMQ